MPGLAIIINPSKSEDAKVSLTKMLASIEHEKFYSSGTYYNEEIGVYVGWSCHPGSYCDCMPIRDVKHGRLLFFYGENHGHSLNLNRSRPDIEAQPKSDASCVLQLFEEKGYQFLEQLNGWYHGLLIDLRRNEVSIFNDRFGMQRLYSHVLGETSFYASEAKALVKIDPELGELDPQGVAEYTTCGCVLENRSLFKRISSLPAASLYVHSATGLRRTCYLKPEMWETQSPLSEEQMEENLREVFPRALARYANGNLGLGLSLTGGYDTRLIMAYLSRSGPRIPTYTFGGPYRECFDVKIARKVARTCGHSHRVLSLGSDFFKKFASLAEKTVYIADGVLGACNAYELYLNKLARDIAVVRLTGSYGSEVLRGARAFKAVMPKPGIFQPDFLPHLQRSVDTFREISNCNPLTFSVYRQGPWMYSNRLAVEQSQVIVRTPYMDNELVELAYRRTGGAVASKDLTRRLIAFGNPKLTELPTDTGNASALWGIASQFLFKADYCYKSGMPQSLERMHYMLGPLQPEKLIRGVHRFAHPRIWFRNELAGYVKEVLLDAPSKERFYLNKGFIETMITEHIRGVSNYADDIERLLTLELAHRLFACG